MSETTEQQDVKEEVKVPRVIAIGDYVKQLDRIVPIPVMHEGELCNVEVRVMKPMADYEQKTLELLSVTFGDRLEELSKRGEVKNIFELPPEDRRELIQFTWLTTASLVSACCYYPDRDENKEPVPKEKARILYEDHVAVAQNCPGDVFRYLKEYLQGVDVTVGSIEAKK
jgi:hypothetical protein